MLINFIEQRKKKRWSESTLVLLNFSHDDQKRLQRQKSRVKDIVIREWQKPKHINSVYVVSGSKVRRDAVCVLCYRDIERNKRNKEIESLIALAAQNGGAKRAVVLGYDVTSKDYPYTVMAGFVDIKLNKSGKDNIQENPL